jgi:Fe-S cluster assembly protein SufB
MTKMDTPDVTNADVKEGVDQETVDAVRKVGGAYKYGWNTDIEMDYAPMGLNEDIVRLISSKNGEPEWMLEWRLQAYRRWLEKEEPTWAMVDYPKINFQNQYY